MEEVKNEHRDHDQNFIIKRQSKPNGIYEANLEVKGKDKNGNLLTKIIVRRN